MDYFLWAWRGDYLNLGAGAEIGFYSRPTWMTQEFESLDQYFTDYNLAVPMTLSLYNYDSESDIECIYNWFPEEDQWWICSFNPEYLRDEIDVKKQVMISCVDFSRFNDGKNNEMYRKLKLTSNREDEFYNDKAEKYLSFDDTNNIIWIMWYEEDKLV